MSRKWTFGVPALWSGASSPAALCALAVSMLVVLTTGCADTSNPDPLPNMQVVKSIRGSIGDEGGDEEEAVAATGVGWGTLRGRFVLSGDAPSFPNFSASKDTEVCGKAPLINETFVVGDDNGIANIVVYVGKASRVNQEAIDTALAESALFDQQGCAFLTHVLPVVVGQTVTLKNSDPVPHNTNISPQGGRPVNPLIPGGGETQHAFARPQSSPFAVTCSVHPWMKGYMFARKDTYVAVSAADGTFEIANLPAGEDIKMRVWHETATGGLAAKSDWAKGRFTVTVEADGTNDLGTIEVPISAFDLP
jgi:plastocyanin